jgi:hypothetical protein
MLLSRELILFVSAQFRTTRTDTPKRSSKKWLCPSIRSSERPHFRQGVNNSLLSEASSLLGGMGTRVRKWMYHFASPIS